jgi:hypothetical protein
VITTSQFGSQNRNLGRSKSHSSSVTGLVLCIGLAATLGAFCLPGAFSAVHPLPLDPKTDNAKCLECHFITPRLNSEFASFGLSRSN